MKKYAGTLTWMLGAIPWGITASINLSENKTGFAIVQILLAVLFVFHGISALKKIKKIRQNRPSCSIRY